VIEARTWESRKAFDLGCGNGTTADYLSTFGFDVTAVDISESGLEIARQRFPHLKTHFGSAYDELHARYGSFPLVISFEVVEHCMDPHAFMKTFLSLIAPGGIGVMSTPYHGYLKNLALAVADKMDHHYTALWPNGHIKFFSIKTLSKLLKDSGAADFRFERVGRIPPLAKSMVAIVQSTSTAS
jgi:2-polyprenyl-3-methyl-5-hydroxy-6-metoxy-1,4-benzoquinol methylase